MRLPSGPGSRGGRRRREDDADAAHDAYGPGRTGLVSSGEQRQYGAGRGPRAYDARQQYPPQAGQGGGPGYGRGPGYAGGDNRPGYGAAGFGAGGNAGPGYGDGGPGYGGAGYGPAYGASGYGGDGAPGYGAQPGYDYGVPGHTSGSYWNVGQGDADQGASPGYQGFSDGVSYRAPGYANGAPAGPGFGPDYGYAGGTGPGDGAAMYGGGGYADGGYAGLGPGYGPGPGYAGVGNDGFDYVNPGFDGPASVGPGYADPAYADPAYADPAYADPGYPYPAYTDPGYAAPGYAAPGYAAPGYAAPGYAAPGYAAPGYAAPGYAAPGYADPGYGEGGHAAVGPGGGPPSAFTEDGPDYPIDPDYPKHRQARRRHYRRGRGVGRLFPAVPVPVLSALAFVACVVLVVAGVGLSRTTASKNPTTTRGNRPAVIAAIDPDCTLIVPQNPLSALGLATPYQLTATNPAMGACHEGDAGQTAFVQAAIINTKTGRISVYDPLVIDRGTAPVAAPVVPTIPANSVVAIWFSYKGTNLTLAGADQMAPVSPSQPLSMDLATSHSSGAGFDFPASAPSSDFLLQQAGCVQGEDINGKFSSFTDAGACNAAAFFAAAEAAMGARKLKVPSPGTAADGQSCLTTRSFAFVDQDQSASVTTAYLSEPGGQVAQDTAANRRALTGASVLTDGTDSGLLSQFVDPALGCRPWQAPNQTDGGALTSALPLEELQAAVWAGKKGSGPAALVPVNDPMTLDADGNFNTDKTSAYRANVDMSPMPAGQSAVQYCADLEQIQGSRLQQDVNLLIKAPSPAPGTADNLFTFMALRLKSSFVSLDCSSFGLTNDVSTTVNANGVTVEACFARPVAPLTPGRGNPTAGTKTCPVTTG